ncbi:unnamed protein product [Onchocerca ochengi]|uniref:Mab-21 domain-containing protein n=1 Tax=Onchocerca ochengi TaxID=42157 RepID=A0A182E995_ONCOC|nr:unnamed protein product [Onchocerca ochengi]
MSLCTHHYSCSHFTLANCQSSCEFLNCECPSKNVEIMHNCFCLQSLLKNATERELLLLPTLSYQNDDSSSNIRLRILLENLHCELGKASNVTIEVRDPNFWLEITDGIDQSVLKKLTTKDHQRSNTMCSGSPTRVYISRLSPWRAIIIALLVSPQNILMTTSFVAPTLPLLVFHCDEPWIAQHLARNEPRRCETYVSDHRTKSPTSTLAHLNRQIRKTENFTKLAVVAEKSDEDYIRILNLVEEKSLLPKGGIRNWKKYLHSINQVIKTKTNKLELHWLSTSRISPAENHVHTSFDLHSYCEAIEDQLFSRALIGAVYRCLLQGVHIPYEDLVEVLEDRCEQSDIEVEGIDDCVRFLCSHIANICKQTENSAADVNDEERNNDFFKDDILYRLNDGDGKSCEEEHEDFRFAFDELLSQNFRFQFNYYFILQCNK